MIIKLSDRRGRFEIPWDVLDQEPALARRVTSECVIIGAQALMHTRAIEYYAYHPDFDPVGVGSVVPTYDMDYDPEKDKVTWKLVE